MKRIEHFFKRFYLDGVIWRHYGTLSPEKIPLVQSERHVYVDPRDRDARKRIVADMARGRFRRNQRFWRRAVETIEPDVALDIGLNYGECLFSTLFPPPARAFGFEANSQLRPWVEKSLSDHPSRERMEVIFQLVGDGSDGEEEFFVDKQHSGQSTAGLDGRSFDRQRYEKVVVPKCSVDQVLQSRGVETRRLFFKIDVEGYEPQVLAGMERTLKGAEQYLGFIEFDGRLLVRAGEDVPGYWDRLTRAFAVFAFTHAEKWYRANDLSVSQLETLCGRHFHTDLVLCPPNDTANAESVLADWEQETVPPRPSRKAA
jgi:FkbM family methyltransferase